MEERTSERTNEHINQYGYINQIETNDEKTEQYRAFKASTTKQNGALPATPRQPQPRRAPHNPDALLTSRRRRRRPRRPRRPRPRSRAPSPS